MIGIEIFLPKTLNLARFSDGRDRKTAYWIDLHSSFLLFVFGFYDCFNFQLISIKKSDAINISVEL